MKLTTDRHEASRGLFAIAELLVDVDIVFAAVTEIFLAVIDQSNSCTLICWFGLIAVVSNNFVLYNTLRLSNSQGKVATLIR